MPSETKSSRRSHRPIGRGSDAGDYRAGAGASTPVTASPKEAPFPPPPLAPAKAATIAGNADRDAVRACKILIIDDEAVNVRLFERILTRAGFDNFIGTTDSREAAALFAELQPDLVVTDWLMPEVNGCDVIDQLRALIATDDYLPFIVLTADITAETKKSALMAGATDFLTKPFDQVEVLLRITNLLKTRLSHLTIQAQNATLEESVRLRTKELERALTELQQTQQQIIQQERLAALGTMAAGIAHDFNNALGIIMGFGEQLLCTDGGLISEHATRSVSTILTAADDASKIVHRLREFYRPDEIEEARIPVDVNELVQQAILLTQPRWQTEALAKGHSISVTVESDEIPCITGDAIELRAALINLIFNAVDALSEGGVIHISMTTQSGAVILKIRDNGSGMSEEVRRHCLEPFFSTKGLGGTGLGLSTVFGIINRHAGSIEIESALGRGSTFVLRLPATSAARTVTPKASLLPNAPLHVLIVDDQPILAELLARCLQDDLHTVEITLSGQDALERFRGGQFDMVITDQVMAGMNGEKLATAIKKLNPKTPVILLTGYSDDSMDGNQCPKVIDLVLRKPLSRAALRNALAKLMVQHIS